MHRQIILNYGQQKSFTHNRCTSLYQDICALTVGFLLSTGHWESPPLFQAQTKYCRQPTGNALKCSQQFFASLLLHLIITLLFLCERVKMAHYNMQSTHLVLYSQHLSTQIAQLDSAENGKYMQKYFISLSEREAS